MQIGDGFSRKTAIMRAITVSACSPPDNNEIVWGFLPGGHAMISSPESRISSSAFNLNSALPPSNNFSNNNLKLLLTFS